MKKAHSADTAKVREAVKGIAYKAPEGLVTISPINNHTSKIVQVGKVKSDGQFEIVWTTGKPVVPDPFPTLVSKKKVLAPGKIVDK